MNESIEIAKNSTEKLLRLSQDEENSLLIKKGERKSKLSSCITTICLNCMIVSFTIGIIIIYLASTEQWNLMLFFLCLGPFLVFLTVFIFNLLVARFLGIEIKLSLDW